jgi:molybdopterin/thiamine biosynthesis adenylyltransferase
MLNLPACCPQIAAPSMSMTSQVLKAIEETIGCLPAETGGMLGGDPETGTVTHFHFDGLAKTSGTAYSPDTEGLNRVLVEDWNTQGVRLLGFVHSHPTSVRKPTTGDLAYAADILMASPDLHEIALPIALTLPDKGSFKLLPFAAFYKDGQLVVEQRDLKIVSEEVPEIAPVFEQQPQFARVRTAYDLACLEGARVICIGCGGAASFIEDLCRAGVGDFVLIDPDVVAETNVATQQAYMSDVGLPKVEVIAERLRHINPLAGVLTCQLSLGHFDDAAFRYLCVTPLREQAPSRVLLCGMTDSFRAQARVNRLALNFGIPSLCAQMYAQGAAAEVTFTHPDVTVACHRCMLRSRYDAYLKDGYINDVTSEGSPYCSTARLNSLIQLVALALLHHGSSHPKWGGMLAAIGRRNLVQVRHDSSVTLPAFRMAFEGANSEMLICDETVWVPMRPYSKCPDCHGLADSSVLKGTFHDTRTMRA